MFRCKRGQKKAFRFRTTATGKKQRLGGCMRGGRFVKVKEVKTLGKTNLAWIRKELEKKKIRERLDKLRKDWLKKKVS